MSSPTKMSLFFDFPCLQGAQWVANGKRLAIQNQDAQGLIFEQLLDHGFIELSSRALATFLDWCAALPGWDDAPVNIRPSAYWERLSLEQQQESVRAWYAYYRANQIDCEEPTMVCDSRGVN